jgi:hypothetical protein
MQSKRSADPQFYRSATQYRQGAGQPQANGANVRVRRCAEFDRAAAKYLGLRAELNVYFEPNDRLVLREHIVGDGAG